MPRDPRKVEKREVRNDYKYGSMLISKFINKLNYKGKKNTARRILYDALDIIAERTKSEPLIMFNKAIENVRPLVEVKARRVGGATYQVPLEVPFDRSQALAVRWILQFAKARAGKPMCQRLAEELLDATKKEGNAVKKREDTHRMADVNKAFAHYRW